MKPFSDCVGKCAICIYGGCCLTGIVDDDFVLASSKQITERLQKGRYSSDKELMIDTLKTQYNIDYEGL